MSTALTRRLPELAAEINREHELCEGNYRTALAHALKVGELLIEAKAQLGHGEWTRWVAASTALSDRNARRYMQLAQAPNRTAMADLGIQDALHSIAQPAAPPPPGNLRTAFGGLDAAGAQAALAELGPMRQEPSRFPSSPHERELWRQAQEALARVKRLMDEASASGLSNWSRREALHEASRNARNAGARLSELADQLG